MFADQSKIECPKDKEIVVKGNGYISSPKYGNNRNYDLGQNCKWTLKPSQSGTLKLVFKNFDIEYGTNCKYDYVRVETSSTSKKFCGNKNPSDIVIKNEPVIITFHSDDYLSKTGFRLAYYFTPKKVAGPCKGSTMILTATNREQFITSLNYPKDYPNNVFCSWRIKSDGHLVRIYLKLPMLTFYSFDLENGQNCAYDSLEIYNAPTNSSKYSEKLCGTKKTFQFIATGKDLYLQFKSDYSVTAGGFKIGIKTTHLERDCGLRPGETKDYISNSIIGGVDSSPNDWPWQALIYVHLRNSIPRCGGTVISDQYIATAAHCVTLTTDLSKYKVILGEHRRKTKDNTEQEFSVEKIIIHPDFKSYTYLNDIALIKLNKRAILNEKVRKICLPDAELTHAECYVTGWGLTKKSGDINKLQQLQISIVNVAKCSTAYFKLYRMQRIWKDRMICAGGEANKDACFGDSGGPLSCRAGNRWVLYGITSFGHECGLGIPGVYTNVLHYVDWIRENAKLN
ncbi:DgyrCDS10861 [Dimorphilus gyrociliatus]|uniref:DgyrCDS10861 n=1 Tax=Dimorphilus gyrociliatus TaxID=2664684 RepID=A0A7I8W445_9ANNE|nr:DgyrCDS10861 [Dimorphilus gyrociliatus]